MLDKRILDFLGGLEIKARLPRGINVMNPYRDGYTLELCKKFYRKFYHDQKPRTLLLGINPGRFGSGLTGISFTDPIRLEADCGIVNTFAKKPELSSEFIYRMIQAFGGTGPFYRHYLISAVSPLGFTKNGININYYDDRKLQEAVTPFIIESINKLLAISFTREKCFCVGEGKNFKFLHKLNEDQGWFSDIIPLAHPRFIMQYRRKMVGSYVQGYLERLESVIGNQ